MWFIERDLRLSVQHVNARRREVRQTHNETRTHEHVCVLWWQSEGPFVHSISIWREVIALSLDSEKRVVNTHTNTMCLSIEIKTEI